MTLVVELPANQTRDKETTASCSHTHTHTHTLMRTHSREHAHTYNQADNGQNHKPLKDDTAPCPPQTHCCHQITGSEVYTTCREDRTRASFVQSPEKYFSFPEDPASFLFSFFCSRKAFRARRALRAQRAFRARRAFDSFLFQEGSRILRE